MGSQNLIVLIHLAPSLLMNINKLSEMMAATAIKESPVTPPIIREVSRVVFAHEDFVFRFEDLQIGLDSTYQFLGNLPGSIGTEFASWRDRYLRYLNIQSVK